MSVLVIESIPENVFLTSRFHCGQKIVEFILRIQELKTQVFGISNEGNPLLTGQFIDICALWQPEDSDARKAPLLEVTADGVPTVRPAKSTKRPRVQPRSADGQNH